MKKTIGVILITYNGEKFIFSQLESLRKQVLTPDKVLIFDDCSTDKTVAIIKKFINRYELKNWEISINTSNYGWEKNCFNALKQCDTDIIFWSDQDDVWYSDKIKELYSIMISKSYLAVYSCWDYMDSNDDNMNIKSGMGTEKVYTVNPFYNGSSIPPLLGCSACFKRELIISLSNIIPCTFNSPDWLLYRLGVTLGEIGYFDKRLFKRRIHQHNVSVTKKTLYKSWKFSYEKQHKMICVLIMQLKAINKLIKHTKNIYTNCDTTFIEKERKYLYHRINFLMHQKQLLKYIYFSFQANSFSDFLNTIFKDSCYCLIKIFKKLKYDYYSNL